MGVASSTRRASGMMFFSFSEVVGMQKFGAGRSGGGAFASASDAQLVWGLAVLPVPCLAVVVGMPVSSGGGRAIFAGGFEFERGTRFRCKFGDDFSRSALSSRRWGSVGGGFVSVAGALFALGHAGSLAAVSRRRMGGGSESSLRAVFPCLFPFSLHCVRVVTACKVEFFVEASTAGPRPLRRRVPLRLARPRRRFFPDGGIWHDSCGSVQMEVPSKSPRRHLLPPHPHGPKDTTVRPCLSFRSLENTPSHDSIIPPSFPRKYQNDSEVGEVDRFELP